MQKDNIIFNNYMQNKTRLRQKEIEILMEQARERMIINDQQKINEKTDTNELITNKDL